MSEGTSLSLGSGVRCAGFESTDAQMAITECDQHAADAKKHTRQHMNTQQGRGHG